MEELEDSCGHSSPNLDSYGSEVRTEISIRLKAERRADAGK